MSDKTYATVLSAAKEACDRSLGDDPPWAQINEALEYFEDCIAENDSLKALVREYREAMKKPHRMEPQETSPKDSFWGGRTVMVMTDENLANFNALKEIEARVDEAVRK